MWLLGLLVACGKSGEVDFPRLLSPLEEVNLAPAVEPVGGDPTPEVLVTAAGEGLVDADGNEVFWAHARGYLHADVATVWAAAQDADVVVDRREVDEWTVDLGTVPEFDPSFTVHNVVHDIITVEYDTTWVHELQGGAVDRPELVVAQWDKTDGSAVIEILRGSMVLRPAADDVTEIELIEHLAAAMRDEETIERYLVDLHASLAAAIHGDPLPSYD